MVNPQIFFEPGAIVQGSKIVRECEPYEYSTGNGEKARLRQYGLECPCGNTFKRKVGTLQRDLKFNRDVRCPQCALGPRAQHLEPFEVKTKPLPVEVAPRVPKPRVPRAKVPKPRVPRTTGLHTKNNYIEEIFSKLAHKYPYLTKAQVNDILNVEAQTLAEQLRTTGTARIPNVVKFTMVERPGRRERLVKNPATGEDMLLPYRPAHRKVKVKLLLDFLVSVEALGSKRVMEAYQRHLRAEPLQRTREVRNQALSKLTTEERKALGLK